MRLLHKLSAYTPLIMWCIDVFLSLVSTAFAIIVIHAVLRLPIQDYLIFPLLGISLVVSVFGTWLFHTFRGVISHAGGEELMRVMYFTVFKGIVMVPGAYLTQYHFFGAQLAAIIMLDLLSTALLMMLVRVFLINLYHRLLRYSNKSDLHALVYGTSEAAISLAIYLVNKNTDYHIAGFFTRRKEMNNMRIQGLKAYYYPTNQDFEENVKKHQINCLLFVNNQDLHKDDELVSLCLKNGISVRIAPLMEASTTSMANLQMRAIQIEDLLGREEIKISLDKIGYEIANRTIMVTGAAGSIGSELCRQICNFKPRNLVLVDMGETPTYQIDLELRNKFPEQPFIAVISDVRDYDRMDKLLTEYQPDIIMHAAAYKHVPLMEQYPCEAVRANIQGTKNMADLAVKHGVQKFVMISTDKSVKPSNCMGATKHLAEMYIQSLGQAVKEGKISGKTQFVTTRFGNVLGSNGSVIPLFRKQIEEGGPITITDPEVIRYFMTIPEACRLVLEAAFMGEGNDIFIFDMGEPVKIVDLAKRMIELSGLRPNTDIEIKYIGLRPGEKLYEELLYNKEASIPTTHPKIFRSQTIERDYEYINKVISTLIQTAITGDSLETVRQMKNITPAFQSQNSEYAELDKENK